jgi:hypothetical protein
MVTKMLAAALCAALAVPALAQDTPGLLAVAPSDVADRNEGLAQVTAADGTRRNPMSVVAINALYGGAAGAVVGVGVALIEGDNWARDVTVGAGLGVLAGAVVGGYMAYGDQGDRIALDGLGTPTRDRDRQRRMTPVAAYALRW